jgi:hypothetical protein
MDKQASVNRAKKTKGAPLGFFACPAFKRRADYFRFNACTGISRSR